jgi:hypothetical protein
MVGANDVGAQMARRMAKLEREFESRQRAIVTAGMLQVKDEVVDRAKKASGGDLVLSNVGKSGRKIGAGFDVKGNRNPVAKLKPRGPLALVEKSIPSHFITRKGVARNRLNAAGRVTGLTGRSGRRRRASTFGDVSGLGAGGRPLNIPGIGYRMWVRHPGISAAAQPRPFARGVRKGEPKAVRKMVEESRAAARRGMR